MAIQLAGKRFNYILEDDRASEHPTVFVIRELTAERRGEIFDLFGDVARLSELAQTKKLTPASRQELRTLITTVRKGRVMICQIGIASVCGVLNAEGTPTDQPLASILAQIKDPTHIEELASAVLTCNTLATDEKKSCAVPLSSPVPVAAA